MKVARVEEMRAMDTRAIEVYAVADELLMENAGLAAYEVIRQNFDLQNQRFLVLCGSGNNGGDGLVVARKLFSNQASVQILLLGDPEKFKGSARLNYTISQKMDIPCARVHSLKEFENFVNRSDVLIDAIFGTGLDREVGGRYRDFIHIANESGRPIVSLDIPSGINGNTGQIMGIAIRADMTITFGLPKLGNILYPGFEHNGKLFVTHISFAPEIYTNPSVKTQINLPPALPLRAGDAHKGSCGKALFVAGAANYQGAPYFAAMSFLKTGGGLAYLATPQTMAPFIANQGPEIILHPLQANDQGAIAPENLKDILSFAKDMDFVVLGPGTSLVQSTQQLIRELVMKLDKPLLIDGDGLTAIAQDTSVLKGRKAPTILTPHPGEMARLLNVSVSTVQSNRVEILQKACKELNAIIVLKGAHSLIGNPQGEVFVNLSGNSGMATAGSGDVLTGTIAAMFAVFKDALTATRTGVFLHGVAGDLAATTIGQDGLVAGDILGALPQALHHFHQHHEECQTNFYGKVTRL